MKVLYPPIEPYDVQFLEVSGGHRLYVEQCGNPAGLPVVYLHGGPGSGCKSFHRCFFDPAIYRVVLFDQRGAGRSGPAGGIEHNTSSHLLEDLEAIRTTLGIERWLLYGGSWGATLALLYAEAFPERVSGMVLRGTFLARQRDLDWFLGDGARRIYPDGWAEFIAHIPPSQRHEPLAGVLNALLQGPDELAQHRIARAFAHWSGQVTLGRAFDPAALEKTAHAVLLQQARIEMHYASHGYFIEDNQILDHLERLPEVPTVIIHGRRDLVCPLESAYLLQQRLPWAHLRILPDGGHVPAGESMVDALVTAAAELAETLAR